ncbi:MAG: flavodoxin family protein [Anaerolineae bacterium]|jgi:hypothetical protein
MLAVAGLNHGIFEVLHVDAVQVSQLGEYDLLIVGAPTHKAKPSDAVVEMLDNVLEGSLRGTSVAAFDTRLTPDAFPSRMLARLAGLVGYAAPRIAKRLKNAGGRHVGKAEGFLVTGGEGPLQEGEVERAVEWVRGIVRLVGY